MIPDGHEISTSFTNLTTCGRTTKLHQFLEVISQKSCNKGLARNIVYLYFGEHIILHLSTYCT